MRTVDRRQVLGTILAGGLVAGRPARASPLPGIVIDAKPFTQTMTWSCWAAAAVILLRWKSGIRHSELDVARMAGPAFENAFNSNGGLMSAQIGNFAHALGLRIEAPQNYTPEGYHELLRTRGPLWVVSQLDGSTPNPRRHARVLRGATGDGSFAGSTAWVLDPDGGRDYQITMAQFAEELEAIAREDLQNGIALRPQVIRFP